MIDNQTAEVARVTPTTCSRPAQGSAQVWDESLERGASRRAHSQVTCWRRPAHRFIWTRHHWLEPDKIALVKYNSSWGGTLKYVTAPFLMPEELVTQARGPESATTSTAQTSIRPLPARGAPHRLDCAFKPRTECARSNRSPHPHDGARSPVHLRRHLKTITATESSVET